MRKLKSEMCSRPGLAPKKQRLESVGLGEGEGIGEEEGPVRTLCEKGETCRASQTPEGGRGCPSEGQHPRTKREVETHRDGKMEREKSCSHTHL